MRGRIRHETTRLPRQGGVRALSIKSAKKANTENHAAITINLLPQLNRAIGRFLQTTLSLAVGVRGLRIT